MAIKVAALFPVFIETYYSNGLYPVLSRAQRFVTGWLPFSVGDILYALLIIYLLKSLYRFIKSVRRQRNEKQFWISAAKKLVFVFLWVYVVFNLFWGLNYNRLGHAHQLAIQAAPYSTTELTQLTTLLLNRLHTYSVTTANTINERKKKDIFNEAYDSYQYAARENAALTYKTKSVKPSLFSYLGNYLGYTGYYNPFTGEAQVNTTVPKFLQPFTTCHEIGHQLGYAKENEANFAGYLAAKKSTDTAFLYSLYFDLYSYAARELYIRDSATAKKINSQLPLKAKNDFAVLRKFYTQYKNPVEPLIRILYGNFLKANEQPTGMQSYSEVTALLIAWQKKYGTANF